MSFEVFLSKEAVKSLRKQDRKRLNKLKDAIEEMTKDPFTGDVVRLKEYKAFRKRVGEIRILFLVDIAKSEVYIVDILPRGKAYKNL